MALCFAALKRFHRSNFKLSHYRQSSLIEPQWQMNKESRAPNGGLKLKIY